MAIWSPRPPVLIVAKWECPTLEEAEIIKGLGMVPAHCMVSHPGEDQMVILNLRDHRIDKRETYILLPQKQKNPK